MRITTTPRARSREDRAGDPLDGLVNLFDLGIVLSVAFLLAALSSLKLTDALVKPSHGLNDTITVNKNQQVQQLHLAPNQKVIGNGVPAGTVYRLQNGTLVYVANPSSEPAP